MVSLKRGNYISLVMFRFRVQPATETLRINNKRRLSARTEARRNGIFYDSAFSRAIDTRVDGIKLDSGRHSTASRILSGQRSMTAAIRSAHSFASYNEWGAGNENEEKAPVSQEY